tara:strand:- start:291 stop:800 length:510 start_codon:yes stop_codon:yes gene_type:complete
MSVDIQLPEYNVNTVNAVTKPALVYSYTQPAYTSSSTVISKIVSNVLSSQRLGTTIDIRDVSEGYNQLVSEIPWIIDFYNDSVSIKDSKSALPYYKNINRLAISGNLELCNEFLFQLRVERLSDLLLVGTFRLFNRSSEKLTNWDKSLSRAKSEANKRGMEVSELFVGL